MTTPCPACRYRFVDLWRHLRFAHQEVVLLMLDSPQSGSSPEVDHALRDRGYVPARMRDDRLHEDGYALLALLLLALTGAS